MQEDETGTVAALEDSRRIFRTCIEVSGGHVVDMAGDSVLAVFETATGAVRAALLVQERLVERNQSLPESRRMQFRIAVNLGEVLTKQDGSVYGDGINIAARLQALGEPTSVMVSGSVHEQVEGKLPVTFRFHGEHSVRNIAKSVKAYVVNAAPNDEPEIVTNLVTRRKAVLTISAVVLLMAVSAGAWKLYFSTAARAPPIAVQTPPNIPSIAVLPFNNLGGDPDQDYFADGITEDIITALGKVQRLLVIARNSTFQYKGKPVDVRQLGRDLGVRHVLEGSVRKEGNRVRVTAQLIDAGSGAHVWSERYDRPLDDIFAVQDDITSQIIAALDVQMVEGEQARVWRRTTNNVEAYEHFLRGREHVLKFTKEDVALAENELNQAIKVDPNFALAYTQLTSVPLISVILGVSDNPTKDIERAFTLARKAVALDDSQGYSVVLLGRIHMQVGQLDKALELGKRAIALEPNGATTIAVYAHMLEAAGRPEESLAVLNKALRLAPIPEAWIPWLQGNCFRQLGRYDESIAAYERSIALAPKFLWPHVFLVDAYAAAGRESEAKAKAREIMEFDPTFSVDRFLGIFVWYRDPGFLKGYAENMRKSGLN